MSHLRKTKKRAHGGAQIVFVCRRGRTATDKCISDFANTQHFRFTDVPPDGDCFFHTLELYYRNKANMGANKGYRELRARVVNYIIENWDEYSEFGIDQEDVIGLTEEGAWNNNAGDLVVPAAARALNLRINLYDLKAAVPASGGRPAQPKQVIKHIYPDPLPLPPPAETVNVLRMNNNHFGLLEPLPGPAPAAAPAAAPRRKPVVAPNSRMTVKKPNAVANASKAMAAMKLGNKPGPATRSKAKAAAMAAKRRNSLGSRRSSLGSRRSSLGSRRSSLKSNSNSSFEREMKRAIEASKRVEVAARSAENAAKKAEMVAKKEAAKAKIAAKKAEAAAKKAAKKAVNNEQMREAENIQRAIAESLKPTTMPGSFF